MVVFFLFRVVYWALLYTPGTSTALYSYFAHASNSPVMVFELLMNRLWHVPLHVFFTLFAAVGYMFITWIFYSQTAVWVYSFLNWSAAMAPAFYLGLLVAFVIFHFFCMLLDFVRDKLFHCQSRVEDVVAVTDAAPTAVASASAAGDIEMGTLSAKATTAESSTVVPATAIPVEAVAVTAEVVAEEKVAVVAAAEEEKLETIELDDGTQSAKAPAPESVAMA